MQRILLDDPRLIEREKQAIADLDALYPDRVVRYLDSKDKALGKRLSRLYRVIGYETRADMLRAFGFTLEANTGGRPVSTDPETIFGELLHRYEAKGKPTTYGQIIHDNPDLKASLKTLSNKSRELFGHTLNVELLRRGILSSEDSCAKKKISDADARELISFLVEVYGSQEEKPKRYADVVDDLPEMREELSALRSSSQRLFGESFNAHLRHLGVLAPKEDEIPRETIEELLDSLSTSMRESEEELPRTVDELRGRFPEHAKLFKAAKKQGLFTRDQLVERGLVGLSEAALKRKNAARKRQNIRRMSFEDLCVRYVEAFGEGLIFPEDAECELLPGGIVGIDVPRKMELRETVLTLSSKDAIPEVGMPLVPRFCEEEWGGVTVELSRADGSNWPVASLEWGYNLFLCGAIHESESPLLAYQQCVVASVGDSSSGSCFFQVQLRFLHELEASTLLYALVQGGFVSREQLREGSERDNATDKTTEGTPGGVDKEPVDEEASEREDEEKMHQCGERDGRFASVSANESFVSAGTTDDETAIQALQMIYLLSQADSRALPGTLKSEVERKLAGDPTIDAWNLVERVTEALPDLVKGEMKALTFSQCKTAVGPALSLAVPDQWRVVRNYEEDNLLIKAVRPFVIMPTDAEEQLSYANSDKVIYGQDPMGGKGPSEANDIYEEVGIPPLFEALIMNGMFETESELAALKPTVVSVEKLKGRNCEWLVFQMEKAQGFEYYANPITSHTRDFLRFDLCQQDEENAADVRGFVNTLVSSATIADMTPAKVELVLDRACAERVDAAELGEAILNTAKALAVAKEMMGKAFEARYILHATDPSVNEAFLAKVRGVAYVENLALPYFRKIIDACSLQLRLGVSSEECEGLAAVTEAFMALALTGIEQVADEDVEEVKRAGVFDEDVVRNAQACRGRLFEMHRGSVFAVHPSGSVAQKKASPMGGHPWPPRSQRVRSVQTNVEYMTPERAAYLQRMESALTGQSLEVYNVIGRMGGAVDLTDIGWQISSYRAPMDLYDRCIAGLLRDGLLVERVQNAPLEGDETKCKRFYTWRQVDQGGVPHWDWQSYQRWLYDRLEVFSHAGELTHLANVRTGMAAELDRCGLFQGKKKRTLKAQISAIEVQMGRLNGEAAVNSSRVEELARRLSRLMMWLQGRYVG